MRVKSWLLQGGVLVLYGVLALLYVFQVPPVEGPDESGHILYTHYVLENGTLPPLLTRDTIATLTERTDLWNTHTHHPPLYYMTGAALTFWSTRSDIDAYFLHNRMLFERTHTPTMINLWLRPVATDGDTHLFLYSLRLWSVILGAITLIFIYQGAYVVTNHRYMSMLAMLVPVAMPSFLIASASIGNDSLLIMLYTAGILWGLYFWKTPALTIRHGVLVTVLLSATILTKLTGVTLLAIIYGVILWQAWQKRLGWQRALSFMGITGLLTGIVTGGWFWRLYAETGHPLATTTVVDLWGRGEALTWGAFLVDLREIWVSLWVSIGYGDFPFQLPDAYYIYALVIVAIGLGASIVLASPKERPLRLFLLAIIGMLYLFLLYVNMNIDTSYGRLLLPGLLPFALLVVLGWYAIGRWWAVCVLVPLMGASLWVAIAVLPVLYPPLQAVSEVSQSATMMDMNNEIEIALHPIDAGGATLVLDVYVDSNFPADTALAFALHATDTNGRLGYVEHIPGMVDWSTVPTNADTQVYRTQIRVPRSRDVEAVLYVNVLDLATGEIIGSAQALIEQ